MDRLTNYYHLGVHGLRIGFGLQQSTGPWTNVFAYDAARRMTNVTSPAGAFSYQYPATGGQLSPGTRQWQRLLLPNNAYITNAFDKVARMTNTVLYSSGNVIQNRHAYVYNDASQRTQQVRTDGSYVNYGYDNYGQLKSAQGYTSGGSPITSEQFGYNYDAAWNIYQKTNSGNVTTYNNINAINELAQAPYGIFVYDANGNMNYNGYHTYAYDDENQLTSVESSGVTRMEFVYDARGRLRMRLTYTYNSGSESLMSTDATTQGNWSLVETVRYIYDGMLAIQLRGNTTSSYTRGLDLSGSLQGAGGIGGLLARSDSTSHAYYHEDANGNVTYLMNSDQTLGKRYTYDPYGNIIQSSGSVANPFCFSSKEYFYEYSLSYYGYRFYSAYLQRWLNRDPEQERGGVNLYSFVHNMPINAHDPYGLSACTAACGKQNLIDVAVCWVVPITISAGGCYLFPPACAAIARAAAQTAIACTLAAEARYAVCMAGCVTTQKCPPYPIGPYNAPR